MTTPLTHALRELSRLAADVADMLERPEETLPGAGEWLRLESKSGWRCPVLGVSRATIYRLINEGRIRRKKLDGVMYYSAQDAAQAVESTSNHDN